MKQASILGALARGCGLSGSCGILRRSPATSRCCNATKTQQFLPRPPCAGLSATGSSHQVMKFISCRGIGKPHLPSKKTHDHKWQLLLLNPAIAVQIREGPSSPRGIVSWKLEVSKAGPSPFLQAVCLKWDLEAIMY